MRELRRTKKLLQAIAVGALAGIVPASAAQSNGVSAKLPKNLVRVPLCRQSTDYTCGVTALQSVLGFYGDEFRESVLIEALKANAKDGTEFKNMVSFAKARSYLVKTKFDCSLASLKKFIDRKIPVICLIQAWPDKKVNFADDWDDGHYVVAVGYDKDNVYFMDPSTLGHYTFIPVKEFLQRWHDTDNRRQYRHFVLVLRKKNGSLYDPNAVKPLL